LLCRRILCFSGFWANLVGIAVYRGVEFGFYDTLKESIPGPLRGNFAATFAVAYCTTVCGAMLSYPFDTIRRRMMMTSGSGVYYTGWVQAGRQIVATEGARALFGRQSTSALTLWSGLLISVFIAGAGANILRGVAGALVLSLYDK
jgi:solute carrier family 25 (adenine nucleotide translocator) protein 4/5/6/31